jgi:hypothetical protein
VEILRVKIYDLGLWVWQEASVANGDRMGGLLGKDSEQLLKGRSWLSHIESIIIITMNLILLYVKTLSIYEISCKRSVVIRIEPSPTSHSVVIIRVNPLQTLQIWPSDIFSN